MKTTRSRCRTMGKGGFMTMGAHLCGAGWMGAFLVAFGLLGKHLGWGMWPSFALGVIPAFLLGNMMGELTFGLQCWISDRMSRSARGAGNERPKE